MGWKQVFFSREELYEKVWTRPVDEVSREVGISDVGLSKLCRRHGIPVPPRGYWTKVRAGQDVGRPPLRSTGGKPHEVTISRWVGEPDEPLPAEVLEVWARGRPADPPAAFTPGCVKWRHALVAKTATLLAGRSPDIRGVVPLARGGLDIRVSPAMRSRALWLMQVIVERLEASGLVVEIEQGRGNTSVLAFGESVSFGIGERAHRATAIDEKEWAAYAKKYPWRNPRHMMQPSGRLRLRQLFSGGYEVFGWDDSPRSPIEKRVEDFVLVLLKDAWKDAERRRREVYQAQMSELFERRRQSRQRRIERLANGAELFARERDAMELVKALEAHVASGPASPAAMRWIRWAGLHVRRRSVLGAFVQRPPPEHD